MVAGNVHSYVRTGGGGSEQEEGLGGRDNQIPQTVNIINCILLNFNLNVNLPISYNLNAKYMFIAAFWSNLISLYAYIMNHKICQNCLKNL